MRLAAMRVTEREYEFIWSSHHILLDGWSHPLLLRELHELYQSLIEHRAARVEPSRPYRHYIEWLQARDMARAGEFWRKALEGFSTPTPLVVASPPEDGAEPEYFEQQVELTSSESREAESLARAAAVTLNTVSQAAWGLLLSRYSGEPEVVFGATVSGRPPELSGVESMVGLFINTLPVRVRVDETAGVAQWLQRLQDQQAEAREFEYTPLVEVQRWSEVPRETPLFESLLVFENYPDAPSFTAEEDPGGSEATDPSEPVVPLERTNYPLTVAVIPGDRICVRITYDANQIETHAITGMLGHYRALMVDMARHVGQPVSCLSLVGEAERRRLLTEWNDTGRDPGQFAPVSRMVEEQARLAPTAPAVDSPAGTLTYGQLNARANHLARRITALRLGPKPLIAICAERSPKWRLRCWPRSRPAALTCRSTRRIQRSAWP